MARGIDEWFKREIVMRNVRNVKNKDLTPTIPKSDLQGRARYCWGEWNFLRRCRKEPWTGQIGFPGAEQKTQIGLLWDIGWFSGWMNQGEYLETGEQVRMLWRRSIAQTRASERAYPWGADDSYCPEKQNNGSEKPYSKLNKKAW